MKTRWWFMWLLSLGLIVGLLLTGCGPAAATEQPAAVTAPPAAGGADLLSMSWDQIVEEAKKEKELVYYNWWGEEYWKTAASKFKEKYGIDVKVVIGDNTVDKLMAEKDKEQGTVDVQDMGGTSVMLAINAGLFYGPIFEKMPSGDKLDQKLARVQEGVETKGYLVPLYRNQTGFLYDPERVKNPPQTWDELVKFIEENPKQFAYSDPNKGGTGEAMVQTVVTNLTGGLDQYKGDKEVNQAKVAKWNVVWDWFQKHKDQLTLTASNNESIDLLNQGAVSLIIAWDDDTQIALGKGTLFKRAVLYVPQLGMPGGGDSAGILKNAPHKAAGLVWLDFLTSPEMQILMNKMIGPYPARTDITDIQQLIPEEQRQKYGGPWYPLPYKAYAKENFTKYVLMGTPVQ